MVLAGRAEGTTLCELPPDEQKKKNREISVFEERVRRQRIPLAVLQSGFMGTCSVPKLCRFGQRHVCETYQDDIG